MRRTLIALPALALALVACTDTSTYKDQTEEFLDDDPQVEQQIGGDVSGAECTEPDSTDVGTTYTCTADVAELGSRTFDVCIDDEDSFLITAALEPGASGAGTAPCPPDGGAAAGGSAPATATAGSAPATEGG